MSKQFCILGFTVLLTAFIGCGGGEESADSGEAINQNLNTPIPGTMDSSASNGNSRSSGAGESQPNSEGSSTSTPVASNTPTKNGLFPNIAGSSSSNSTGFGGALFPRLDSGSSASTSTGRDSGRSGAGFANSGSADRDNDPFDLGDEFHEDSGESSESFVSTSSEPKISLLLDAKRLFEQHNEQAAVSYLYANHLVSDEARESYKLNWYEGLKEPRLFFRWGVGVIFNKPKDFDGRHPVIGDPGDENEGVSQSSRSGGGRSTNGGLGNPVGRSGGGGRTSSGSRVYKNVDTSRPDGYLLYYTGDFGEKLISYLDSRRADEDAPYYGQILKDVMEVKEPVDETQTAQSNSRRPGINRGGGNGLPTGTGNVGVFGDNNSGRSRGGGGGNTATPLQRTDTSVIDRALGRSTAQKPEDDFMGTIIPGVELLGRGSKTELLERAKEANVDTLILFNVKISKSRGSRNRRNASSAPSSTNTTSMKIVDVKTAENLYSSKSLKDTNVTEDNDEGEDPVKEQVEKAFSNWADEKYKAIEMPKGINESNVKKRIGAVLKSKSSPLRSAVEVVSFYEAGLLSEDLAKTAIKRLFGNDDSTVLVAGTPSQRLNFLREILPEGPGE